MTAPVLPLTWEPERAWLALGARVRTLRLNAFLTQDDLAKLARLTPATIRRLERGRRRARIHTVTSVAAALGVTPEELVPRPSQLWDGDGRG